GNEELIVVGGCARGPKVQSCGVLVGRHSLDSMRALAWVSSGHWFPSLHPDKDPSDLWILGGDDIGRYKRLIAYNWGEVRVGEKERRLPAPTKKKKTRKAKKNR